jgi:hypothetical protein
MKTMLVLLTMLVMCSAPLLGQQSHIVLARDSAYDGGGDTVLTNWRGINPGMGYRFTFWARDCVNVGIEIDYRSNEAPLVFTTTVLVDSTQSAENNGVWLSYLLRNYYTGYDSIPGATSVRLRIIDHDTLQGTTVAEMGGFLDVIR